MGTSALGPGALSAQSSLQQVQESQALQDLQTGSGPNNQARIEKGAKDFEAMLLTTWLQQAEQSYGTVPGAEDDQDDATHDQMMSLGVQSLAQAMVSDGGIGIAKMIAGAMERAAAKTQPAEDAAKPPAAGAKPATEGKIERKN